MKVILYRVHHHCVSRVISSLITHKCYKQARKYRDKIKNLAAGNVTSLVLPPISSDDKNNGNFGFIVRLVMRLLKVLVSAFSSVKLCNNSSLRRHKHNVYSNSHKHKTMSAWIPTWHLHTMSASIARRSTTFPFPSSPH